VVLNGNGFITTDANVLGEPEFQWRRQGLFYGMVLFNDWSARDIKMDVPLGPS